MLQISVPDVQCLQQAALAGCEVHPDCADHRLSVLWLLLPCSDSIVQQVALPDLVLPTHQMCRCETMLLQHLMSRPQLTIMLTEQAELFGSCSAASTSFRLNASFNADPGHLAFQNL